MMFTQIVVVADHQVHADSYCRTLHSDSRWGFQMLHKHPRYAISTYQEIY